MAGTTTDLGRGLRFSLLAATLVLAWLVAMPASKAGAADFPVTKTTDTADGTCDADCSLREAVIEANAAVGADRVLIPPGNYTLTLAGAGEDLAATGDLDLTTSDIELRGTGAGPSSVIIDAGGLGDRIIHAFSDFRILNLTLRGGTETDGGAIHSDGEGTIRDVVFDQNAAADDGGAIYSEGTFARVTVEDSSFTGNTADTGGAIYNQDASTTVVTRSTFTGNVANTRGGGIYNQNDGAFTLEHSRMEDNRAEGAGFSRDGGAVFTQNTSSFTIVRSVLANNEAQDAGGAIFVQNDSALAISDTTISGNTASGTAASDGGGAIYANNDSALLIARSTLSGNTSAGDAGGISRNNDGQLLMHNSTVSGNTAGGNGGGIIFDSFGGGAFIALESSTVAGNSAVGLGGGIYNEGDPLQEAGFERSIIASNTAAGAANDCATDGTGVFVSNGFNLDSTGTCGLGAPGDIATGNPALGPLADNGGPTETRALLTGSDAIDAAGNCTSPVIDQRGVDRPLGAACDIGAYEASPPVAVPDTTPPVLTLGGDKKQKVGRLKVEVSCDEACTATGGGKITVRKGTGKGKGKRKMKKKSFKLEDTSKDLAAGETKNLKLKPGGKKKRRKLKRAVKRAGKGKAEVTVTVTDQSGNSAKEKLSVKVKP